MSHINLLPLQEKRIIFFEESKRIVLFLAILAIAILGIGTVLLLPSYLPVIFEEGNTVRALELQESSTDRFGAKETISKVRTVKSAILAINALATLPRNASSITKEFVENPGDGVTIYSFSTRKDRNFTLLGKAENRRNLLQFEKVLRDSGKFQEISSPLSNIIRESDINFSINGKFKTPYSL